MKTRDGFWCVHDTPGMLIVPPGMIVALAGQHNTDKDGASGVRWGKQDYQKNATVAVCAKDVTEMMSTYEELRGKRNARRGWASSRKSWLEVRALGELSISFLLAALLQQQQQQYVTCKR